jgi:hypothetical protein
MIIIIVIIIVTKTTNTKYTVTIGYHSLYVPQNIKELKLTDKIVMHIKYIL